MTERMDFSTKAIKSAPAMTASTPPFPLQRIESSGTAALYRPMMEAIWLMPSRDVIMPSMPPKIGVPPKRSVAR